MDFTSNINNSYRAPAAGIENLRRAREAAQQRLQKHDMRARLGELIEKKNTTSAKPAAPTPSINEDSINLAKSVGELVAAPLKKVNELLLYNNDLSLKPKTENKRILGNYIDLVA
jgi:hypothetical protein